MGSLTTTIAGMLLVTCMMCHVTSVNGEFVDYLSLRNITDATRKCFEDEGWPCELPLTEFPWSLTRFETFLNDSRMPALYPDDLKPDYNAFLALFKKAKIYSLLGSCMGYGHRLLILREMFGHFFGGGSGGGPPADAEVEIEDTTFAGIPVKLYTPTAHQHYQRAAIFYIHGGGWTLGSAAEMDGITRRMAIRGNFVVASVDYRLAPEHVFPAGFDDCVKAIKHFMRYASRYGVNKYRIAVSGDSSGGNLAAAVALKLRCCHGTPLKMQALIYPALQAFDFNTPSYQENACDPYLDRPWMISFWMWYALGNMPSSMLPVLSSNAHTTSSAKLWYGRYVSKSMLPRDVQATYDPSGVVRRGNSTVWNSLKRVITNKYFSPLLASSVARLPHTYMFTCEQDVLRDEGFMYASRLRRAGVKVEHAHHQALHALVDDVSTPFASAAVNRMIDYLKRHL